MISFVLKQESKELKLSSVDVWQKSLRCSRRALIENWSEVQNMLCSPLISVQHLPLIRASISVDQMSLQTKSDRLLSLEHYPFKFLRFIWYRHVCEQKLFCNLHCHSNMLCKTFHNHELGQKQQSSLHVHCKVVQDLSEGCQMCSGL